MLPRARSLPILPPHPSPGEEPAALDLASWGLRRGRRVRLQLPDDALGGALHAGEWLVADPVVPTLLVPGDVVVARLQAGLTALRVASLELRRSGPGQLVAAWLSLTSDGGGEPLVVEGSQVLGRAVGVDRAGVILPIPARPSRTLTLSLRGLVFAFTLALTVVALLRH